MAKEERKSEKEREGVRKSHKSTAAYGYILCRYTVRGKGTAGCDRIQDELLWFYWVTLAYHNPDLSPSRLCLKYTCTY